MMMLPGDAEISARRGRDSVFNILPHLCPQTSGAGQQSRQNRGDCSEIVAVVGYAGRTGLDGAAARDRGPVFQTGRAGLKIRPTVPRRWHGPLRPVTVAGLPSLI